MARGMQDRCPVAGCGRRLGRATYRFPTPTGYIERCGRCALTYPPVVRSALRTAAVVGTILTVINHGTALLTGRVGVGLAAEIPLTFIVPYAVSTYAALTVSRVRP